MPNPPKDKHWRPHPKHNRVERHFNFQVGSKLPYPIIHILFPSGDHELRYDVLSSGRVKFHEAAILRVRGWEYVGNACKLDLPEVFRMESLGDKL